MIVHWYFLITLQVAINLVQASLLTKKAPFVPWDHLTCKRDEVACLDRRQCVSKAKVCDGYQDCMDSSDESDCQDSCPGDLFRCTTGKCIEMKYVCDSFSDCGEDGSDEANCLDIEGPPCPVGQYRCEEDVCISMRSVCDGHQDCPRNDDETRCKSKPGTELSRRANTTPKEPLKIHNQPKQSAYKLESDLSAFVSHSIDKYNPQHFSTRMGGLKSERKTTPKPLPEIFNIPRKSKELSCLPNEFKCSDNLRCIPIASRCNHKFDCVDQSDEHKCTTTCSYGIFRCHSGKCAISSWLCNATDWAGRRVTVMMQDFEAFL